MADFSITCDRRRTVTLYRLEGVFTGQAAFELKRQIAEEGSLRLELDFSRVVRFFDFGLAAFATELPSVTREGQTVELLGLSLHHRRLLHYFGLSLPEYEAAAGDDLKPDVPAAAQPAAQAQ
jgi:hypothetical protein